MPDRFDDPPMSGMTSLQFARRVLRANLKKGSNCGCCGQFVRQYDRKISYRIALALVWLVRTYEQKIADGIDPAKAWTHQSTAPVAVLLSHELDKLGLFGLIERRVNAEKKKRESGMWRPTKEGIDFAKGHGRVPKFITVLFKLKIDESKETVTIRESFREDFDYQELMAASLSDLGGVIQRWAEAHKRKNKQE